MDELATTVCEIVALELEIPVTMVRPESHVEEDLGIDSLAAVRIGVEIESHFGIEMPEIPDVRCVQDLIDLVRGIQAASARNSG